MASPQRRYSYPKFLDGQSIRLLKIPDAAPTITATGPRPESSTQASTQTHPPKLSLQVIQLPMANAPPYLALSYTWGPPSPDHPPYTQADMLPIAIDGEEHEVAPNLFDALVQTSHSHPGSYLWVDALCINQSDVKERQIHVAVMDKIYSLAEEVIVWVGKHHHNHHHHHDEHQAEEVFKLIDTVGRLHGGLNDTFWFEVDIDKLVRYNLPDVTSELWRWYLDFYDRRYFNRGWVIQEVALARRATLYWGHFTMPWPTVVAGAGIFVPERVRRTFFSLFRNVGGSASMALGRNAYRIGLMQDACLRGDFGSLLVVEFSTGTRGLSSAEHVLLHLMRMGRDFEWTDPRDQVYSLLGLVNFTARHRGLEPLSNIEPDYSAASTHATVLTAAATAIIKRCGYLGIISQVSDLSFRSVEGLPSWVPDFRKSPNFSMEQVAHFDACGGGGGGTRQPASIPTHVPPVPPHNHLFQHGPKTLFVKATFLGTILQSQDLNHENHLEKILPILDVAYQSTKPPNQDRADVLWRTMLWDVYSTAEYPDQHPASASVAGSFVRWIESVLVEREDSRASPMDAVVSSTHGKSPDNISEQKRLESQFKNINWPAPHLQNVEVLTTTIKQDLSSTPTPAATTTTSKIHNLFHTHLLPSNHKPDPSTPSPQSQSRSQSQSNPLTKIESGSYITFASGVTWAQSLLLTNGGHLALGPRSTLTGDEVWVISGCPFPMVLRRQSDSFLVLGRTYVHGVMHGEAVTDESVWEDLRLE